MKTPLGTYGEKLLGSLTHGVTVRWAHSLRVPRRLAGRRLRNDGCRRREALDQPTRPSHASLHGQSWFLGTRRGQSPQVADETRMPVSRHRGQYWLLLGARPHCCTRCPGGCGGTRPDERASSAIQPVVQPGERERSGRSLLTILPGRCTFRTTSTISETCVLVVSRAEAAKPTPSGSSQQEAATTCSLVGHSTW